MLFKAGFVIINGAYVHNSLHWPIDCLNVEQFLMGVNLVPLCVLPLWIDTGCSVLRPPQLRHSSNEFREMVKFNADVRQKPLTYDFRFLATLVERIFRSRFEWLTRVEVLSKTRWHNYKANVLEKTFCANFNSVAETQKRTAMVIEAFRRGLITSKWDNDQPESCLEID